MTFDIAAEIAAQTAAYTNPLTVAEKDDTRLRLIDCDEYWEKREAARQLRIVRADEMADGRK